MTQGFSTDEMNERIIESLNGMLEKFCFGEYKAEINYPGLVTVSKIESDAKNFDYCVKLAAQKDADGVLKIAMIRIFRL